MTAPAPPLDWPHYGLGFAAAVKRGFRKYATFSGRASRREFWFWHLFVLILSVALVAVGALVGALFPHATDAGSALEPVVTTAFLLCFLSVAVPTAAVLVRRLHDAGYSGWTYWYGLIPVVGGIILLVALASETSENAPRYGPPLS